MTITKAAAMQLSDAQDFDRLQRWATLTDAELTRAYSLDARRLAERLLSRLFTPEERKVPLTRDTFPDLVRRLARRVKCGARHLGEAIIAGSEARDKGDDALAIERFEAFVRFCPSACYREVAEHYLEDLYGDSACENGRASRE